MRLLLDVLSSMRSLSVLLSAVGTTCTTQTVLVLAWSPSEIIRTRVRMPRMPATATIRGRRLFHSRALDCVATIRGRRLFEGGIYSRAASIRRNTVGSYTRSNDLYCLLISFIWSVSLWLDHLQWMAQVLVFLPHV